MFKLLSVKLRFRYSSLIIYLLIQNIFSSGFSQGIKENFIKQELSRNLSAHILSEDGLSQNTVHSILEDSKGFMWFATEDGLNKYDGYNFTVYKNDPRDKNSIPDNFIWTLFEDKYGVLWIGTNSGGLCKFDREKEVFTTYKNIPGNPNSISLNNIRSIYEDKEGTLWIGTEGGGLEKFERENNRFIHYRNDPHDQSSISDNVILSIFEDNSGDLWVGHNAGLDKLNRERNKFVHFPRLIKNSAAGLRPVFSICQDKEGSIIAGTINGLAKSDIKKNLFGSYLINTSNRNLSRINIIVQDKEGILWAGTGSGLFMFNEAPAYSLLNDSELGELNILGNNNVLSLYEDNSGLIWIGTAEEGLYIFNRERTKFKHFMHDPFNSESLSYNTVRSIFQEKDGTLWIGTLGGGLNRLNPGSSKFIHYRSDPSDRNSLSDNTISAIYKDKKGYLWIGTWNGGLDRSIYPSNKPGKFKPEFKHYRNDPDDPGSLSSNLVQAIFEDSDGILWIGTGTGLNIYDRKKDNFIKLFNTPGNPYSLTDNQVQSCIIEDRDGNLWIGTWGGLSRFTKENRRLALTNPSAIKFISYRYSEGSSKTPGLSDDRIISAYEDVEGDLWFGTYGGGLNKLPYSEKNYPAPRFQNINMDNGLASNIIYCIQGDKNDNLWLSSDNGLTLLDTKKNVIRNYTAKDGLQGNQFFWGASFKGINGELFFGGTNGFNAFQPEELRINAHIPPIFITNFQIFNKSVPVNENGSPLKKSIESTKEIELSYSQNVFSFEFTALDFTAPDKNRYKYFMEGFDKGWIHSGSRRFVTYTNLDPGEYIFKVAGSNSDGTWNEAGASIKIRILPPFWRTWWFILISSVFLVSLASYIIGSRIRNLLAIERLRSKLAADLHDNIGSGLTEISILSEVISKKINPEDTGVKKSLKMISDTSRSLIDGMSDIVWLVNPKRDSLYDLILRLRDTYSELFSYTDISFRSENIKALEKVSLSMEHRQHLYLIFKEAINNSISHSGCHEITLDASVKGKKLEMVLKDNGKGFCFDEVSNGNGLTNIKERAKMIGGELTINSKEGEGTLVKFEGAIL
ncbi:MAG TPA: two-component regulator propeller domain-containing protein [Ignavibacteriaceae bacterium]|nr:two-component regulator propeller domain-containing protein [Ignavibacteriaceae bacterium]